MSKNDRATELAERDAELADAQNQGQDAAERALATRPATNGALTEYEPSSAGMSGSFDEGDIKLPSCRLLQPMSQAEGGTQGHYWFDQEGRDVESFEAVVLNIIGTAAMWKPIGEGDGKGPVCKSIDRVMGLTSEPSLVLKDPDKVDGEPIYIQCSLCPRRADWEVLRSSPMHCSKGFTLLMCEVETREPFLYYVKGTQFSPVRDRIVSPALLRRKRYGNAQPWLTPFTWTTRIVEQPGKKYFVPVIVAGKPFDAEERDFFAGLSVQLAGRAEEQALDELQEQEIDEGQQNFD